jgi:serine/threonine protein kinase
LGLLAVPVLRGLDSLALSSSGDLTRTLCKQLGCGSSPFPLRVPSRLNPEIPARLEEIIDKSLEKDSEMRYQSASELRTNLKRLRRDTDSGRSSVRGGTVATIPAAAPREHDLSSDSQMVAVLVQRHQAALVAAMLGVVLSVGAIAAWFCFHSFRKTSALKIVPFTSLPGAKSQPAFSPDDPAERTCVCDSQHRKTVTALG